MKTISPIKFLTAVGFLIVSLGFETNAQTTSAVETREACENGCDGTSASECKTKYADDASKEQSCNDLAEKKCRAKCKSKTSEAQLDKKEGKCDSATDKYNTAATAASGACESFEKVTGSDKTTKQSANTCDARINACRKKINSGVGADSSSDDPSSGNSSTDLMKTMMGIYVQNQFPKANPNQFPMDGTTTGPSCTNFVPKDARKEKKAEQKDLDTQIKDLNKSITEEKKKITDENAKLREKNADIDSDIQKVEEALKKDIAKVEGAKRDRLVKLNEEIAKSAANIRNLNSVIIKRKEDSESIKFDYAQKMQQFTSDKILTQCQSALDTAKQCFLKARKGQVSGDSKDVCAGFTFSGNGAKGTAQLKAKIQKVQDACFEQANMSVTKANFEQGKSLRTIETDITEKTNQVNDANNALSRNQTASTAEDTASAKETADVSDNSQKQIDNLKTKLAGLTKSTQEAVQVSNERLQQLANQLNDLNTKKAAAKMGIAEPEELNDSLQDAEGLISARENARKTAMTACCPTDKSVDPDASYSDNDMKKDSFKSLPQTCKVLIRSGTKQVDDKGRSSGAKQGTKQ